MIKEFFESSKSTDQFIEDAVTSASVSAEHPGQSPDRPLEDEVELVDNH